MKPKFKPPRKVEEFAYYYEFEDGTFTLHCPHEPSSDVSVVDYQWGQLILCDKCLLQVVEVYSEHD